MTKFYTFELKYLWSQLANLDQILCIASLGVGKGCIMFLGRLDRNWCSWQQKAPIDWQWGKWGLHLLSQLLLIPSFLYLQITRTCIKSQKSSNFGQIGPLTLELAALERLKISHSLIMGKWCLHASSFIFDRIIIKVAGIKAKLSLILGRIRPLIIAPLWKSGDYTGFALSFRHSVNLYFCQFVTFLM